MSAPSAAKSKGYSVTYASAAVGYQHAQEGIAASQIEVRSDFQALDTSSSLNKYAIWIIVVYLAAGCAFFSWAEDWEWPDALYFCV